MLITKQTQNQLPNETVISNSSVIENEDEERKHGYGSWAGQIIMSDDFDEPLEDLAEYM